MHQNRVVSRPRRTTGAGFHPQILLRRLFPEAVRTREKPGSHAERSHRVATIYHLANAAFRCGRPLRFDPVTEQIVGDEEANRLVNQPMRSPWRL
jgi:hypothetical protein